ncbi:hypothetical protein ACFQ48_19090 [Hymenobacter caeli]|uniref:Uncharacterized protein n=1 Tax=Hymenobacter caeli TaxID=2735894 RepID=A0ABX2FVS4_9BACT|nr:hypothetical protein [Hymenobacter caeli]NRT21116.1 hypothetical protein [Hymenobacter caeli]
MTASFRFLALLGLLGLGAARAQAVGQTVTAEAVTTTLPAPTPYSAAHDSLMRRVTNVHAQTAARLGAFQASQGSFGGLHRRVRSYVGELGPRNSLIKWQTVKYRFGIELEKVVYYDLYSRKVLTERYEGRRLVRLELREYPAALTALNKPTATWLLVRGSYLRHKTQPFGVAPTTSYYFDQPRPGEGI